MAEPAHSSSRAICNYEGTSYRANFWEGQGREYEDLAERIALRHLLPPRGARLMEAGAGFGRLVDLYRGYEQVILLDYAKSGLREAQERLGHDRRYVFVAADLYLLPIAPGTCDAVVTVRVLHHMADVPAALRNLADALRPGGSYVLEYANKRNLKAIARFWLRRQRWSPFAEEPVEFAELNFDFHPRWMARELARAGFRIESERAVSHFRMQPLKRLGPPRLLAGLDGVIQGPGSRLKLAPSVFLRCRKDEGGRTKGEGPEEDVSSFILPRPPALHPSSLFRCPKCQAQQWDEQPEALRCLACGSIWPVDAGIYDFKTGS